MTTRTTQRLRKPPELLQQGQNSGGLWLTNLLRGHHMAPSNGYHEEGELLLEDLSQRRCRWVWEQQMELLEWWPDKRGSRSSGGGQLQQQHSRLLKESSGLI